MVYASLSAVPVDHSDAEYSSVDEGRQSKVTDVKRSHTNSFKKDRCMQNTVIPINNVKNIW